MKWAARHCLVQVRPLAQQCGCVFARARWKLGEGFSASAGQPPPECATRRCWLRLIFKNEEQNSSKPRDTARLATMAMTRGGAFRSLHTSTPPSSMIRDTAARAKLVSLQAQLMHSTLGNTHGRARSRCVDGGATRGGGAFAAPPCWRRRPLPRCTIANDGCAHQQPARLGRQGKEDSAVLFRWRAMECPPRQLLASCQRKNAQRRSLLGAAERPPARRDPCSLAATSAAGRSTCPRPQTQGSGSINSRRGAGRECPSHSRAQGIGQAALRQPGVVLPVSAALEQM